MKIENLDHRYAVLVQDLDTQWIQAYPSKTKTSKETQKLAQVLGDKQPKVITLTFLWNSAKPVKMSPGIMHVCTTQIRNKRDCGESSAQSKKNTFAVLLQSSLNKNWWADSMECYTDFRNIQDLLFENSIRKAFLEKRSKHRSISLVHLLNITLFLKKVLLGLFLGYALYAERFWKGDVLVAYLEELETVDASEIYSKRFNSKEVIFPKEKRRIYFSNRRWTNQYFWRRSGPENIHLGTAATSNWRKSP